MTHSPTAADRILILVRSHHVYPRVARSLHDASVPGGRPVVIAVSGGGDSTALALLVAAGIEYSAHATVLAYFDHEHDTARHALEWRHVCDLAGMLGARPARGSASSYRDIGGRGVEETWRNKRYAFLRQLAGPEGIVLTGHTMDDVAETFLLAAMRGGSGSAMAGPRSADQRIIRPVLTVRRSELRDLLRTVGVGWIEDPTNMGDTPRAWVRAHLLEILKSRFGSRAVEGLAQSARVVREWSCAIDTEAEEAARRCVRGGHNEALLDLASLGSYPRAVRRRVLRNVLSAQGLPVGARLSAPVDDLLRLCEGARSRRLQLPGGLHAVRSSGLLRIASSLPSRWARAVLPLPGHAVFGEWAMMASVVWCGRGWNGRMPAGPAVAMLDRDAVREPLCVRARERGDRVVPMGMKGAVRLKSYMRDRGVPLWSRWSIPLVCDADGRILWIPGIVRSMDAPIRARTARVLLLHAAAAGMREEE